MNGITVSMAIVDFIPVLLFFFSMVLLQVDLYRHMIKPAFAMLASGSFLVLLSGLYKAIWKILYALDICDFTALDHSFFPMQGPGFFLVFLSLLTLLVYQGRKGIKLLSVGLVPVYESNLIFILLQTFGCGGMEWCLFAIAKRMKQKVSMILFVIAFLSMLGMGYLSAAFDDSADMHWIAQMVNIISQGALYLGVYFLHRNHLADACIVRGKVKGQVAATKDEPKKEGRQ